MKFPEAIRQHTRFLSIPALAVVLSLWAAESSDGQMKDILGDVEKALEKPTPAPTPKPSSSVSPKGDASRKSTADPPQSPATKPEGSSQKGAKKKAPPAVERTRTPRFTAKSTLVSPSQLKKLPRKPSDTWLHGTFIAARTDGKIVLFHPIFAGGFIRGYSTEVHVTFVGGVPSSMVRQLPQDPMYSTVGSSFPKSHPVHIKDVYRTSDGILRVIATLY